MKIWRAIHSVLLFTTLALFFLLTIVSRWYPFLGKVGVTVWYMSYLLFFILAIQNLGFILKNVFQKRFIATSAVILFLIILVCSHLNDAQSISFETANQTTCIINHLKNASDGGFNQTCMNGYPARQYLLSSIPTILFGPSLWTLHLGGSLYFFLGLIIFSGSALRRFDDYKMGDFTIATVLASILHIYYFNHFMFIYEQSIFPFSMTLIAAGLLLDFENEISLWPIMFLGLLSFWLIFGYTTGIAVFFLLSFILFCSMFKKNQPKMIRIVTFCVLVFSIIGFWLSLGTRGDIHIREGTLSNTQLKNDLIGAFKHIVWQEQGNTMVSSTINGIFLFIVFSALLFMFGWEGFVLGAWMISVLIFSVISKGYWYYPIDFRLHRALIIFPFIFFLIVKKLDKTEIRSKKTAYAFIVVFLFILLTGIAFHHKHISSRKESRNNQITKWMTTNFPKQYIGKENHIFFATPNAGPIDDSYSSQNDYVAYFLPGSKSEVVDSSCSNLLNTAQENTFLFISPNEEQKYCYHDPSISLDYISSFTYKMDGELKFYRINHR